MHKGEDVSVARVCLTPQCCRLLPVLQSLAPHALHGLGPSRSLLLEHRLPFATGSKIQPKPWFKFSSVQLPIPTLQPKAISLTIHSVPTTKQREF